ASGSFADDGFVAGQRIVIGASDDAGFDANNGEYVIAGVSGDGLTITLTATGVWAQAGNTGTEAVPLSIVFDGDFEVAADDVDLLYSDNLTFGDNGTNLTITGISDLQVLGFAVGDTIAIKTTAGDGFSANDGDFVIAGFSNGGTTITLETLGTWDEDGITDLDVDLSKVNLRSVTDQVITLKTG